MSQPSPPPQAPNALGPQEQDALVKQIGLALIRSAPEHWQEIKAEFRAVGRYFELSADAADEGGHWQPWTASQDIAMMFARLRAGMHGERGGTWFNARYSVRRPAAYNLEFDRAEPQWRNAPPLPAYRDELQMFPRGEADVPEWLTRKLTGPQQPGRQGPRFRIARIFDRPGSNGRPAVDRQPLPDPERDRMQEYLDRATVILPMRGHDVDRLAPDGRQSVPVAFHSDGTWIWPAAVNYYLRTYGIPPEPALVEHARSNDFMPPEVDEATRAAAATNITGGRPPAPAPQPAPAPPPVTEPPAPAPKPASVAPAVAPPMGADQVLDELRALLHELEVRESAYRIEEPPEERTWHLEEVEDGWQVGWYEREFSTPTLFDDVSDAAAFLLGKLLLAGEHWSASDPDTGDDLDAGDLDDRDAGADDAGDGEYDRDQDARPEFDPEPPPPPQRPMPSPSVADAFGARRARTDRFEVGPALADTAPQPPPLGAEPTTFERQPYEQQGRPGDMFTPAPAATDPAAVETQLHEPVTASGTGPGAPERAPGGGEQLPGAHAMGAHPTVMAPLPPAGGNGATGANTEPVIGSHPGSPAGEAIAPHTAEPVAQRPRPEPPQGGAWPIQPMPGEPPLTLFRSKRMVDAPVGTEIDRYGSTTGNLTYEAGTPFQARSLPAEWEQREYHLYRVQRPMSVLSGEAISWFDQPGGGTALLLPASVAELLDSGDLVEVDTGSTDHNGGYER